MDISIDLVECFPKDASSGHMHLVVQEGTISENGNKLGTIGFDVGCQLVLEIQGRRFHISAQSIWEQVNKNLLITGTPLQPSVAELYDELKDINNLQPNEFKK